MTGPLDPLLGGSEQQVEYLYRPVSFQGGDLVVIPGGDLPLSGVQFSQAIAGAGDLRGSLQLAAPSVRAMNPWQKVIPRKTGIVVVRRSRDPLSGDWRSTVVDFYIVWVADRDPASGRLLIAGSTVESLWAKRYITKGISWAGVDQITLHNDLLLPSKWSLIPLGVNGFPGWLTVDPSTTVSGQPRTFSYADRQETNLLEAMVNRSRVPGGYEWHTGVRVLSGVDAASAASYRLQLVTGYPTLGRSAGSDFRLPRLRFDVGGSGNVLGFQVKYDGSDVPNIVWGRGNGYEENQTRAQVQNTDVLGRNEWDYGFLQTEALFSDPDVSVAQTLANYCYRYMWDRLSSEQFIAQLSVRGDRPPYFGEYVRGDQLRFDTNDATWPPDMFSGGYVQLMTRLFGWVVKPPQGDQAETVDLIITGSRAA